MLALSIFNLGDVFAVLCWYTLLSYYLYFPQSIFTRFERAQTFSHIFRNLPFYLKRTTLGFLFASYQQVGCIRLALRLKPFNAIHYRGSSTLHGSIILTVSLVRKQERKYLVVCRFSFMLYSGLLISEHFFFFLLGCFYIGTCQSAYCFVKSEKLKKKCAYIIIQLYLQGNLTK